MKKSKSSSQFENSSFENSIKKIKKRKLIFWLVTPTVLSLSVGGAIYFAVKNSKISFKGKITVEQFLEKAKNVKLSSNLSINQLTDNVINNYEEQIKNKNFDAHKFISTYISNNLSFSDLQYLNFKYVSLKKNNDNSVEITYEITLNYDKTIGEIESKKVRGTPNSKYYFKSKQTVSLNISTEELSNNSKFNNLIKDKLEDFKKIIREREDPSDTNGNLWFSSEKFKQKIWDLFKNIFIEANAYSETYPKSIYEVDKYLGDLVNENPNYKYVEWNPNKGLNSLTVNFCYRNIKTNKKINPKRFILTIEDI